MGMLIRMYFALFFALRLKVERRSKGLEQPANAGFLLDSCYENYCDRESVSMSLVDLNNRSVFFKLLQVTVIQFSSGVTFT